MVQLLLFLPRIGNKQKMKDRDMVQLYKKVAWRAERAHPPAQAVQILRKPRKLMAESKGKQTSVNIVYNKRVDIYCKQAEDKLLTFPLLLLKFDYHF